MAITEVAVGSWTAFSVGTGWDAIGYLPDEGVYVATLRVGAMASGQEFDFMWRSWDSGFSYEMEWGHTHMDSGDAHGSNTAVTLAPAVCPAGGEVYLQGRQTAGPLTGVPYIISRIS